MGKCIAVEARDLFLSFWGQFSQFLIKPFSLLTSWQSKLGLYLVGFNQQVCWYACDADNVHIYLFKLELPFYAHPGLLKVSGQFTCKQCNLLCKVVNFVPS